MKTLAKLLVLTVGIMTFNGLAFAYSDVTNTDPHYVAINYLSEKAVLQGYEDGTFQPDKLVNRAEALKIIFEGLTIEIDENLETADLFSDVPEDAWFAKYVAYGKEKGVINGNPDGTYAPDRSVARSEFLKILLNSIGFKNEQWENQKLYEDVPEQEWFTPYMNYAGKAGLITPSEENNLEPGKQLSRAEVSEILYLMIVILNGKNTQFLIDESEAQMAQIEIYIASNDIVSAKRAAELGVDLTQQAYSNMPENNVVLGAAKIARAYDYLVNAYISALQNDSDQALDWANQTIEKATEAWEANNETQPIARHIKDRAREIIDELEAS